MKIGLFCINLTGDGNDNVSDDVVDRIGNDDLTGSVTAEVEAVRNGAIVRTVLLLLTTGRELKVGLAPAAAPE